MVPGLVLGASHAPLNEVITKSETAKVKRTMYTETTREKAEVQDAIRISEWNAEMNPLVVRAVSPLRILHDFSKGYERWLFRFYVDLECSCSGLASFLLHSTFAISPSLITPGIPFD